MPLILRYAAAMIGVAVVLASPSFGRAPAGAPVLVLRVIDDAGVPGGVLAGPREHVEQVFRAVGIRTEWASGSGASSAVLPGAPRLQLTVILVSETAARRLHPLKSVAGISLSNNGEGARLAYVVVDRAMAQAESVWAAIPTLNRAKAQSLILGHVIAHELGHLMLPYGTHTTKGLMKELLDRNGVQDAAEGDMQFLPEHGELIRKALERQSRGS